MAFPEPVSQGDVDPPKISPHSCRDANLFSDFVENHLRKKFKSFFYFTSATTLDTTAKV